MTNKEHISKRRLIVKWGIVLLCIALLLGAAYYIGRHFELSGNSGEVERGDLAARFANQRTVEYAGKRYAYNPMLTNILLLGTDNDEARPATASRGFRSGGQADFLMLLVLDSQKKTVARIQIDRDAMTQLTVLGVLGNVTGTREAQICLAHYFGDGGHESCKLTAQAVKSLLGDIDINLYAAMNMDAISTLNDWLGGVTVTIADDFTAVDPTMAKGSTVKLQGQQAEYFVRSRMNVGDGSNTQRMIRQRQFLAGANSLMKERLQKDKKAAGGLFDLLSDSLVTNMSRGRLINEMDRAYSYKMGDILNLKGRHALSTDGFVEFYPDPVALTRLVLDIFYFSLD